jgi:hypothetical protein
VTRIILLRLPDEPAFPAHRERPEDLRHVGHPEGVIDWNLELRKLEREYDGLPPAPTPARVRAERAEALRAKEREAALGALVATWARLLLVGALATALWWWPYGRTCGLPLGGFLSAVLMVIVGGSWVAASAWRARLAVPHVIAVGLLVLGLAIAAAESVPRLGYGDLAWVRGDAWRCSGVAPDAFIPR